MRFFLVITTIIYTAFSLEAQRVSVSPAIDLGQNTQYTILGKTNGVNTLFIEDRKKFELLAYDDNLHKLWDLSLRENPSDVRVSGVFTYHNNVHFFYSIRNIDSTFLIHKTYSTKAKVLDSTLILRTDSRLKNPFLFAYSDDKSKVLFFNPTFKKKIHIVTYDLNTRKILWKSDFIFDENINDEFQFIELSNSGKAFVVIDKDNKRFRIEDHAIVVYEYSGSGSVKKHEVNFADKLTYHLSGIYDNLNNQLVLGGFYSDKSLSDAEGIFLYQLNDKKQQPYFQHFKAHTLQDIYGQKGKNYSSLSDIEVADIILARDGGAIILGEIRKEYQQRMNYSNTFSPGMSNSIDFYYEDLLACGISADYKHRWTRVIHKRQFSQDDYAAFSSFFTFKVPSFLQLIFNDEISSNSTVSSFGINGYGEINRTNLMSTGLQGLRIRFKKAIQTSSTSFLAPSEFKGDLKLVKVEF